MKNQPKKKVKPVAPQRDYCFTCRIPVSKCKGDCTRAQQKANGG